MPGKCAQSEINLTNVKRRTELSDVKIFHNSTRLLRLQFLLDKTNLLETELSPYIP